MNDGAYLPLPNLAPYLDRLEIDAAKEPTLAFLDELIYAHQLHVPFENLDVYEKHLEPSLAVPDLFDKIVVRKRGGYCFEMNGLFCALLRDLGFSVQPGMARVRLRPDPHPILSHRISLVLFDDGLYLADVGFGGPMPGFALKIEDGFTRTGHGQTFSIHAISEHWWAVNYLYSSGEDKPVLNVCSLPSEESDFLPLSYFQSQWPLSNFRQHRLANIRTSNGSRALSDMTYTEHCNDQVKTVEIESQSMLEQVLCEHFGIENWQ